MRVSERIVIGLAVWVASVFFVGIFFSVPVPAADSPKAAKSRPVEHKDVKHSKEKTRGGVKPAKQDVLLMAYGDDPDSLNLIIANDTTAKGFHRRVYESLAARRFDDPDKWEHQLAESWSFDKEKLEYTIKLRKGVKWHPMKLPDGALLPEKELTSRDVKFTFDCILNSNVEAAAVRSYYEDPNAEDEAHRYLIKVSTVDKHTVKIKWSKPYFLSDAYTLEVQIMPQHVYSVDEKGEPISSDVSSKEFAAGFNNHWANTMMCGTGPMMFEQWKRNEVLSVVRNPNYWGEPYYFDRVVARCVSNPNTMTELVLKNELDFAGILDKERYLDSQDHPAVKAGKVRLVDYTFPGYRFIGYNLKKPLFADKQVRHAIGHAVPLDTIIQEVFKGLAEPVNGPFQAGSSANDASVKPLAYDLEKSKSLLDQAGWKDSDDDGVRDKQIDGAKVDARFELMIFSDAPSFRTVAEIIKDNLRKVGVDMRIEPAKWALMLQKLRKKEFDAAMLGWAMAWRQDPFQIFHGSQADLQESSNSGGYQNPEVDKLIEELRVTLDEDKQIELYHKIHRAVFDDQPYTFLFTEKATAGLDGRIENMKVYKLIPCYDPREWFAGTARMLGQ